MLPNHLLVQNLHPALQVIPRLENRPRRIVRLQPRRPPRRLIPQRHPNIGLTCTRAIGPVNRGCPILSRLLRKGGIPRTPTLLPRPRRDPRAPSIRSPRRLNGWDRTNPNFRAAILSNQTRRHPEQKIGCHPEQVPAHRDQSKDPHLGMLARVNKPLKSYVRGRFLLPIPYSLFPVFTPARVLRYTSSPVHSL
jgi:hypothetical protein